MASDLTCAIASLLPVTDSLAVCWLNGPALNRAQTFISTAHEMFATRLYPLTLWVAARWDSNSRALFTQGMAQFNAPELLLAQQPDPAPLMVDYLSQLALSLLTSPHPIAAGGIVDGPHGCLRVRSGTPEDREKDFNPRTRALKTVLDLAATAFINALPGATPVPQSASKSLTLAGDSA